MTISIASKFRPPDQIFIRCQTIKFSLKMLNFEILPEAASDRVDRNDVRRCPRGPNPLHSATQTIFKTNSLTHHNFFLKLISRILRLQNSQILTDIKNRDLGPGASRIDHRHKTEGSQTPNTPHWCPRPISDLVASIYGPLRKVENRVL